MTKTLHPVDVRNIYYTPRLTQARTQYREIPQEDRAWLLAQLNRAVILMSTLGNTQDVTMASVRRDFWHRVNNTLPHGRSARNTPETFTSGLVDNLVYGTQRDLSAPQCDGVEFIMEWMNAVWPDLFPRVVFQIEVYPSVSSALASRTN